MNCQDCEHELGDYIDGTLDGPALARFEAHLATCARCRALAADFGAIRTATLALDPQQPPPHVWTKLAAAFEAQPRRRGFFLWNVIPLQAVGAAAMILVLASSLSWVGDRLTGGTAPVPGDGGTLASTAAPRGGAVGVMEPIDAEYELAEQHFKTAIAGLEQVARDEGSALDADTADVLRVNLGVIDTAIDESRTALATEPDSEIAQESLFEALRAKVALLQETVALINEMRKGNQEGAARIITGLNQ